VSEKRIGLNRRPPPPRLWALNGPEPIGSARLRGR
jgi:hypothetical protein